VFVLIFPLSAVASMGSAGFLLVYAAVSIGHGATHSCSARSAESGSGSTRAGAETAATGENGRALVLVRTAVDREIERRHPELKSSGYRPSVARSAYEAGSHAGKHVDLAECRLGRSSPALSDAAPG